MQIDPVPAPKSEITSVLAIILFGLSHNTLKTFSYNSDVHRNTFSHNLKFRVQTTNFYELVWNKYSIHITTHFSKLYSLDFIVNLTNYIDTEKNLEE